MEDVFELMEQEQQFDRLKQEMIEILEENHWSETVILTDQRQQRVLHEFLVEGKSLNEIAEWCGVSRERVRQIKDKAKLRLQVYLYQLKNAPPTIESYIEPVIIKEFGYDIYDVMAQPDESRIEEVKQLLSTPVENLDFSVRSFNCIKAAKLKFLGDLLQFSVNDLLRFKGFGKRSLLEIEALIIENGLTFRNSFASTEPYVRNAQVSNPVYTPKPPLKFTLPVSYPVLNFTWSEEILQAFKEHNIITIEGLLMARELLLENKELAPEHFNFIERRLDEWGLKWK